MRHTLGDIEVRLWWWLRKGLRLFDVEFIGGGGGFTANTGELGHDVRENWEICRVWIHGYCRFVMGGLSFWVCIKKRNVIESDGVTVCCSLRLNI